MEIRLRTLTPLWTGGVDQTCDRLHETGIIGSLRWWYEAIVRGLGGQACDPTNSTCKDRNHCAVCELFGCTGWKRKIRLELEYNSSDVTAQGGLKGGALLTLRLHALKPLAPEEKWLLAKTVEIISKYGAIGGKKTLKPQPNQSVGNDFGLVRVEKNIDHESLSLQYVQAFLHRFRVSESPNWPNLKWFFFVRDHFLWRKQMNTLMGLDEKGSPLPKRTPLECFLGSTQAGVSKKLFSFKEGGRRLWGYVDDERKLEEIKVQLKKLNISENSILDGSQVIDLIAEAS